MRKLPRISGVLKEFPLMGEDNKGNFSITENRDLMSFLEKTSSSFGECHLSIDLVLYPLQLNPTPPHFDPFLRNYYFF